MKEYKNKTDFDSLELKIASPEKILEWSYGEVTRPETINYRTQRSEKNGLFDEKIFGPERDYECYCGKYKGIRYRGIVCEKCGVEVTRSVVRRQRMGHIELASPVSHIWYLRSIPSRIGLILDIPMAELEKVIYFAGYVVMDVNEDKRKEVLTKIDAEYKEKVANLKEEENIEKLKSVFSSVKKEIQQIQKGVVLDEPTYARFSSKYADMFTSGIGAESILNLTQQVDLKKLEKELSKSLEEASASEHPKIAKRLQLVRNLYLSGVKPEWIFLKRIPIIPPAIRPMVSLGGGRHATSDINDLYRRVINRNNRLKKLMDIGAPDVILRNEKRILQEAVDALIDNSMRNSGSAIMSQAQKRPLKSLSDNLKGKSGVFRTNLLGKRVDYSGRSVIVVGPNLKLDECGLPKYMALELFRPFVISRLIEQEYAHNIKVASRLVSEGHDYVWAILEEEIQGKYVLLNRAPTLHKLGIQAFKPLLIEGKAIQIHPLVCAAFNADFDGDAMAVHVPLSPEAQIESKEIIASDKNVLKPGNGELIVNSTLDIVLGIYWSTKMVEGLKGEGKFFSSPNDAINAWDFGIVDFRAKITVMATDTPKYACFENGTFETTVGRLLFNSHLPSDYSYVNALIDKKDIGALESDLIAYYGITEISKIIDKIKEFGFRFATHSGITWGNEDVVVPEKKPELIAAGEKKVAAVWDQYDQGLISIEERRRRNVEIWMAVKSQVEQEIPGGMDPNSSASDMTSSGARGKKGNLSTMAGMKGIVQNASGGSLEHPIKSSAKEGLSPVEYFITTHGTRKGLADTALNTAKAGYLTRRLFDVCQDLVIREKDCGTKDFVTVTQQTQSGIHIPISKNIRGRYLAAPVVDKEGNTLFKKGHFVTIKDARDIKDAEIEEVHVRSPITCKTLDGVCQKCYGMDMGNDQVVDLGETVGTIAAQAIGEPGTQLTMRTFHQGGAASQAGDITMGLPRVEEIFERRKPAVPAVIAKRAGQVTDITQDDNKKLITILSEPEGQAKSGKEEIYKIPFLRTPNVKVGDTVSKGQLITDGSANLEELLKFAGHEVTQNYIISETVSLYELQGSSVDRKHIEVVVKQMFSRSKVIETGETTLLAGQIVENSYLEEVNNSAKEAGKTPATGESIVLGVTEVSLSRRSFLSAASFQHTVRVLIDSSLKAAKDELKGLKENVILGRLIPAGSGFEGSRKYNLVKKVQDSIEAEIEEKQRIQEEEQARIAEESTQQELAQTD